jgi:xanthine dehydrogenase accessory factor
VSTSHKARPVVIVIGCDEIGSAIAWTLHHASAAVVVIDAADPPWPRRGMSYTDAWYVGGATLDHLDACFCSSVRSLPAILARGDMIAATTWSWEGVAAALGASAVVETRPGASRAVGKSRPAALTGVLAIGVRTTRVSEWHADVVIAGASEPHVASRTARRSSDHEPSAWRTSGTDGVIHRIETPHAGRFRTRCEIGERIESGDVVGEVGSFTAFAPVAGVLRGLTARGARVDAGQTLVEIDPAGEASDCFRMTAEARAIAHRVNAAIRRWRQAASPKPADADAGSRTPPPADAVAPRMPRPADAGAPRTSPPADAAAPPPAADAVASSL